MVFFDQELFVENLPAKVILLRSVDFLYFRDTSMEKYVTREELMLRYRLSDCQELFYACMDQFLSKLRNEELLRDHQVKIRRNVAAIQDNRRHMNYSAKRYQSVFVDVFKELEKRDICVFGAGKYATRFIEECQGEYGIDYILDNNESLWGTRIEGIEIVSPERLKELEAGTYKVIICVKNYELIIEQLEKLGVREYSVYDPQTYYQTKPRTSIRIIDEEKTKESQKKYAVGYVAGAFDMFHIGHLNLLRNAKEYCDHLIVGVMSDARVRELKHRDSVIPCEQRMQVVAGCRYADQVEELQVGRAGIRDAYHMFHYDCMFSGDNHNTDPGWLEEQEYLRRHGADIVFLPYTKETSSTEIRDKINKK